MPALMSKRPSAALGEIHREIDRRRKLAAVAKGRIVKKSCAPLPIPNAETGAAIQKSPTPIPIKKPSPSRPRAPAIAYVPLGEAPGRCTAPNGRPTPFGMKVAVVAKEGIQKSPPAPIPHKRAEAAIKNPSLPTPPHKLAEPATKKSSAPTPPPHPSSAGFEPIKEGTKVSVRTRMGTLPTGLRLFIWLSAVVVSDAGDGYFQVMYNGDFPRDNPFRDVRVARDQVKIMPSSHQ